MVCCPLFVSRFKTTDTLIFVGKHLENSYGKMIDAVDCFCNRKRNADGRCGSQSDLAEV